MARLTLFFVMALASVMLASAAVDKKGAGNPKPGRFLFYMPLISKSMKITFMPLAEELASRGHQVVVVMPYEAKAREGVEVITIHSPYDGNEKVHYC